MALTKDPTGKAAPSGGFQDLGWYNGYQYYQGSFAPQAGQIHPNSPQSGSGQTVSQEVKTQSALEQNVSPQSFDQFLKDVSASSIQSPATVPYNTGANESYLTGLTQEVLNARKALEDNLNTQRTKTQAELDAAKARENAALSEVDKLTTPFRQDLENSERARLGTDTVLSDQKALLGELDQLLTEGNDLIRQQKGETGLASIRNPRIQKTMDDVAARAGVINAVVNLQNTYLANAYTSIDRSVTAITDDRKDRLNYYGAILDLANRDIISLTAEDKRLAEEQTNLLKNDLDRAQTTSDYIKELMINPDTALALAQAGVTLNDPVEVINTKLANYQYAQEIKDLSNTMGTSGYSVVTNPSSVPADKLVTITDSKGNKYYYQKSVSADGFDASGFIQKLTDAGFQVSGGGTDGSDTVVGNIWDEVLSNSNSTLAGRPNFTPAGGIGTVWTDPSGQRWIYTADGWVAFNSTAFSLGLDLNSNTSSSAQLKQ